MSSFFNFLVLGFLPSKFIYGFVYDFGVGHNSAAAMATIMFSPIISVLAYYLVGYLIIRDDVLRYEERKAGKNCSSCCKIRCCGRLSFCRTSSVPGVKKGCYSRLNCFRRKKVKEYLSPPF